MPRFSSSAFSASLIVVALAIARRSPVQRGRTAMRRLRAAPLPFAPAPVQQHAKHACRSNSLCQLFPRATEVLFHAVNNLRSQITGRE